MVEQLQWLTQCGRPWAAERAQTALEMLAALERQEITESEYQELMQDLIRSDKLNEVADDQDTKNLLVSCIMVGAKLA